MSNWKRDEQNRREGMAYALKIAKERGIEGLEKECKMRGATQIPTAIRSEVVEECLIKIKTQLSDCMCAASVLSVMDLYKSDRYAVKKALEFKDHFYGHIQNLLDGTYDWQDVIDELSDRGVDLMIRLVNMDDTEIPDEPAEHHRKVGSV